MKRLLFFLILSILCFSISAQTKTWIGDSGSNFNVPTNWNPTGVPGTTNDVVIPSGSLVIINSVTAVKSIAIQGTATVNLSNNLTFTAASSTASASTVNWSQGALSGGSTFTNNGTFNLPSTNNKFIEGSTTFKNKGDFNITDSGDLNINEGIFNNEASGTIDMQAYIGDINYTEGTSHILNNSGTIKKTYSGNPAYIYVNVNNNGGTISVQIGMLGFEGLNKNINSGIFNVSAGATLRWNSNTVLNGTLTGLLNGKIDWINTVTIANGNTATFNFTGDDGVSWSNGTLTGGGTLVNQSLIDLPSTNNKTIEGSTILSNEANFSISDSGDLLINEGVFNNETSGTIDMQAYVGNISYTEISTSNILNNFGTIKKTISGNPAAIEVVLNNDNGTINVEVGTLHFSDLDKNLTDGVYNVGTNAMLQWNANIVLDGVLTGVLDGAINWTGTVTIPDGEQATFNFTGDSGVSWSNGTLGGGGTLVNQSLISLPSTNDKTIVDMTSLSNKGNFNIIDSGDLHINEGVFDNEATGTIDMRAYVGNISYTGTSESHILNNFGTIKKTNSGNPANIEVVLNNHNGTINVEIGTLHFSDLEKNLTDGDYNVSSGATLQWNSNTILEGTLTGTLNGEINWTNTVTVVDDNPATFNFTGDGRVRWSNGTLSGGGTLTNQSLIYLPTTDNKAIEGSTTLSNEGDFLITDSGDLNINEGVFNNETSGIIEMQAYVGDISFTEGSSHILNNYGTLKKTSSGNPAYIYVETTNSGIIDVQVGTLYFQDSSNLNNTVDGVISGITSIGLPESANFTNDGTFAPGGSPGTLNVLGDFKSSSSSKLEIEVNGSNQGTEYDLLAIQGNAVFDGSIDLLMGYAANVGDEFIVATTTGTITQCNLQPTASGTFDGYTYNFDVICRNDNQIVLTVSSIVLGTQENSLSSLKMYPNPSDGNFTIDLSKEYTDVSVHIYNILGQLISSEKYASAKIISQGINTSAGIYFVKVSTAKEGSETLRIIKL